MQTRKPTRGSSVNGSANALLVTKNGKKSNGKQSRDPPPQDDKLKQLSGAVDGQELLRVLTEVRN